MPNDGRTSGAATHPPCRSGTNHHRVASRVLSSWFVLLAVVAGGAPAQAAPRAEAETLEVDLGVLPRGASAEAVFVLRNTGDEVLRVLHAKPG